MNLVVDPEREGKMPGTGIFIRAKSPLGTWSSFDIDELTYDSLMEWLRSRGGDNPWAENVVASILGHRWKP